MGLSSSATLLGPRSRQGPRLLPSAEVRRRLSGSVDRGEERRVGAHERLALLRDERALAVAALLHPAVGVAHGERALLGRKAHVGGGDA